MKRVICVTDNLKLVNAIQTLFALSEVYECVGVYNSERFNSKIVLDKRPDWVVFDMEYYLLKGYRMVNIFKQAYQEVHILIAPIDSAIQEQNKHTSNILPGHLVVVNIEFFLAMVVDTLKDRYLISRDFLSRLHQDILDTSVSKAYYRISKSEQKVINCLLKGLSYKEIAVDLNLKLETIKSHVQNIYRKVGIHSRSELVSIWSRYGLLQQNHLQ